MTGAQPRLPVGKNVTLDWMRRGTDFKAPPDPRSVRWRGEGRPKKLADTVTRLQSMAFDWKAGGVHNRRNETCWLTGLPDVLLLV